MGTFLAVGIGLIVILFIYANRSVDHELAKASEERDAKMAKWEAERLRLKQLVAREAAEWSFLDLTKIDGQAGLIGMDERGQVLRLATYDEASDTLEIDRDEHFAISTIKSITVSQPTRSKTAVYSDRTPVVVQSKKKSPGGRALVGAALAGPVGALVGAASGIGTESTVEYHQTQRSQEGQVKGHAILILGTGDIKRPTIRLAFEDNVILNQWSARLWAARGW